MERFNNTTIFTGYLKQLLHSFNLPKYRIYTEEHRKYFEEHGKERSDIIQTVTVNSDLYPNNLNYVPYIRNGEIQEYIDGKWVKVGLENANTTHMHNYANGIHILNYTKNLQIRSNSYDSYTHEYLGDYLRFQRDYNNINLMPLYNCFSNRACDRLDISFTHLASDAQYVQTAAPAEPTRGRSRSAAPTHNTKALPPIGTLGEGYFIKEIVKGPKGEEKSKIIEITDQKTIDWINSHEEKFERDLGTEDDGTKEVPSFSVERTFKLFKTGPDTVSTKIKFTTSDSDYKIYMVPVKLFAEYTIAIDSETPIDICCGLYGAYQDTRPRFKDIPSATYKKYTTLKFGQPVLYTKLKEFCEGLSSDELTDLAQNECDLKIFLKVPQNNTSTIVILEGNYLGWNDVKFDGTGKATQNHSVLNFGNSKLAKSDLPLKTSLQLLRFNTHQQHPFADRLIEYLLGNAITPVDDLAKNVLRVQKAMIAGTRDNPAYQYVPENEGLWDKETRYILYDYMNSFIKDPSINHDILGYVDKDVEKWYAYPDENNPNKEITLLNTEVDEEE